MKAGYGKSRAFCRRPEVPGLGLSLVLVITSLSFVAYAAETDPMPLRLGGCGGVYFYAETGELWVEVTKQDLNRRSSKTHLRALLVGPDRRVLEEAWLADDGQPRNSGPGPVQHARLTTQVTRPGVYALNITVTEDRYGENMSWGFRTNCPKYLIETSRGHKDARHEEPIVLRSAGRPGNVVFRPGTKAFSIDIRGLTSHAKTVPVYDRSGTAITQISVSPEGQQAQHRFPADKTRHNALWRLHLPDAQTQIHIDGVTRWQRGDPWEDLSFWTPDLSSWFGLHENRWLLTPYSRKIYGQGDEEGTVLFTVHNNELARKRVKLALEFDGSAPWAELSHTEVDLEPYASEQVPVTYRVPQEGTEWQCALRATVVDDTQFSTWSSLTLRRGKAPAASPVTLPIKLEPYAHENEQFGYLPEYPLDNQVYFDMANRPFIVADKGVFHQKKGSWHKTTQARRGDVDRVFPIRPVGTKIAFDRDNDVYLLARDGGTTVLLHSTDHGVTFTAWPIPGSGSFDMEQFSGHNCPAGPPCLARFHQTARDPKRIWRRINDLDLILPGKRPDGSIAMGDPVAVSKMCIGLSSHSGIPSTVVSRDDKVHIAWGEATDPEINAPGVPTYVATYNRTTGRLGAPALVGHGPPANDIHNSPCITMDSRGTLHVLIGTHGRTFKYVRSLQPNRTNQGWTEAQDVGPGLRQTYVGMVCDKDDTLHVVFRLWRYDRTYFPASHYACLAYMSKRPGEPWSEARNLVVAPFSDYSIFYHRLTIDRQGALFLSYDYWSTYWFYRTDHRGKRRSLLMSPNGGEAWQFAPDFR